MTCLRVTVDDEDLSTSSLLLWSGADNMKRLLGSKCMRGKRRRELVFDLVRNESTKSLLRMVENHSFDTDWNRMRGFAGSRESMSRMRFIRDVCCGVIIMILVTWWWWW